MASPLFPSRQPRRQNTAPDGSPSHRRNDGSWIEVASQPSSSSLSSIGDEIVTTGLRVGSNSYPPRRRRLQQRRPAQASYMSNSINAPAETSSQEEYEETDSEDDQVMTSSNEHVPGLNRQSAVFASAVDCASDGDEDEDDDDDDENATALGRPSSSPTFRPQPNAFSHPPSNPPHRHSTGSTAPHHHPYLPHSSASHRSQPRTHRHFMSPSYRADNDEALRSSLTTLLSCAAAARGRPRKDDGFEGLTRPGGVGTGIMPSSQPVELHLVPESELMGRGLSPGSPPHHPQQQQQQQQQQEQQPPQRQKFQNAASPNPKPSSSNSPKVRGSSAAPAEKSKRPSTPQSARSPRATKKKRTASDTDGATFISPTILTWVVSAGVLVLVSVVGFGAGYVIGREVGRQEGSLGIGSIGGSTHDAAANTSSCGRELAKSTSGGTLRRFRWSAVAKSVAA